MEKEFYYNIDKNAVTELKERGSRFIAYAYPVLSVDDCKTKLNVLKKEHPKATHHCFAYRVGSEGDVYRVNDAGEPSGTAGKQILGQIDSRQLTNTLVVVVRYFGGTLLGVPELINAYKSVTALVLQLTPVSQKAVEAAYLLRFNYTQVNDVMTIIKQCDCSIIEQQMMLFCEILIGIPLGRLSEALHRLADIRDIELVKRNKPSCPQII
ncbi:MAG: YigZ family protein [Chitinophagaceae bacterium]